MKSPVRSMTGFASHRAQTSAGELTITLRSVNHRSLDIHFHAGADFAAFENEIRAVLKQHVARGHLEVRLSLERRAESARVGLNRELLNAYVAAFREAAYELQLISQPDLNVMLGLRGVVEESSGRDELPENFLPELLAGLEQCARELNEHREREGEALREEISRQRADIAAATRRIAELRERILQEFQERLRTKLGELLAAAEISQARVLEEAALLADRSDIQEELVRLGAHLNELEKLVTEGGEIGKRLDFLAQEMNREANTTLSKSANAGEPGLAVTTLGLEIKAKIEKIREQALNLE
ncbi:MAG TPA: YicC/YloC family endoribonuclease [Bryobacteraceae bacterium]|jgi:uncharacterized protein (TIGR00255 family)|nr:YicC/YloC family endoribonuclease [Bryobacteraceae bacterium]